MPRDVGKGGGKIKTMVSSVGRGVIVNIDGHWSGWRSHRWDNRLHGISFARGKAEPEVYSLNHLKEAVMSWVCAPYP